jgi:hypothetical protein
MAVCQQRGMNLLLQMGSRNVNRFWPQGMLRLVLFGSALLLAAHAAAQSVTVSVGGVPKYSGIMTNEKDVNDFKDINQFLNVLESQLAGEFVKYSDVDYLDRTNTLEIFREKHLSSGPSFDPSSGAVRGLMGRLDYLVVLDSFEPSSARIRLIDVETGAVKALESCKRRTSFLGISSDAPPECIPLFVAKAHAVTGAKLASKRERVQKQQETTQRQEREATEQRGKDAEAQRALDRKRQQEQAAAEVQRKQEEAAAQQLAAQQAQDQAEREARIAELKPSLDDAMSRLSSEQTFWKNLEVQMAAEGHSLRPNIHSALTNVKNDGRRCQDMLARQDTEHLQSCVDDLNRHLDVLDAFK